MQVEEEEEREEKEEMVAFITKVALVMEVVDEGFMAGFKRGLASLTGI